MKKIVKQVDKERGIIQVTVADERWYIRPKENKITGLPDYEYVPSVTWVTSYYYTSPYLVEWIAKQGLDEAERIRRAAGDKGSKVHSAIVDLIDGKKVGMDSKYMNYTTEQEEELTLEEYDCIKSFVDWYNEVKPKILDREFVVWGDGYAGTGDLLAEINGEVWLIDNKTSKSIWKEHIAQVSAYAEALKNQHTLKQPVKLGILQLGYGLNKKGFKFTEIDNRYDLFQIAKQIWKEEAGLTLPKTKDYPVELKLEKFEIKQEETKQKK